MTVDIEKLAALAKNATPGPWWIDSHGMTMMSMAKLEVVFNHPAQGVAVRNEDTGNLSHWRNDWDASFIAAANPEVVLELTQTIRDLQAEIDEAELLSAPVTFLPFCGPVQVLLGNLGARHSFFPSRSCPKNRSDYLNLVREMILRATPGREEGMTGT